MRVLISDFANPSSGDVAMMIAAANRLATMGAQVTLFERWESKPFFQRFGVDHMRHVFVRIDDPFDGISTASGLVNAFRERLPMQFNDMREHIADHDMLFIGPGGRFVDGYQNARELLPAALAQSLGKPVIVLHQSVGPVDNPNHRALIREIFSQCRLALIRDDQSLEFVRELGVPADRAIRTRDIVLGETYPAPNSPIYDLGINIRYGWNGHLSLDALAQFITEYHAQRPRARILVYSTAFYLTDEVVARLATLPCDCQRDIIPYPDYLHVIGQCTTNVSDSYHGVLFSMMAERPVVCCQTDLRTWKLEGISAPGQPALRVVPGLVNAEGVHQVLDAILSIERDPLPVLDQQRQIVEYGRTMSRQGWNLVEQALREQPRPSPAVEIASGGIRVIALLAVYNEERYIAQCLEHLTRQGIELYLIDNESTDRTVSIAKQYEGEGLIGIETFPRGGVYQWKALLRRMEELALALEADWFLRIDADEIHLPPRSGITLAQAFAEVEAQGYNAVNFLEFTFLPTQESPDHDHPDFQKTMRWYFSTVPFEGHLVRAWKRQPVRVDLTSTAGHQVQFPNARIYPHRFPMRHYQFLSVPHAISKYVRKAFDVQELAGGMHSWRAQITPDLIRLPSEKEMRLYMSDDRLDASNPQPYEYYAKIVEEANGILQRRQNAPIIVGGCHRSGTSLVQRILSANSRIFRGPEVEFFADFYSIFLNDPIDFARFMASARSVQDEGELLDLLEQTFIPIHERAAQHANKPRWADKNPDNSLFWRAWQRLLGDDWVFVHVVRNPLDTIASIKDAKFNHAIPDDLSGQITLYQRNLRSALEFASKHPNRYYQVIYEELVNQPEAALRRLMYWLGESFEPAQLEFNQTNHQTSFEDPQIRTTIRIRRESVGRWKTLLTQSEAEQIAEATSALWKKIDPAGEFFVVPSGFPPKSPESEHSIDLLKKIPNIAALDLGCGALKSPGFIGLDRFALSGVDIIADLNGGLPFPDNSFALVFASHALEHVNDLTATMREIYRVCRHGAQVCIVAPYSAQAINAANPYHIQAFNEHTPRFWTTSDQTLIDPREYWHPHADRWALGASDNSDPGMDLRCLRMEFFYFPEYRYLPPEEQRAARKKYLDVCDVIVYHLIVVKEPISEAEMKELAQRIEYYDPPYVKIRRLEEQLVQAEAQARTALAAREAELAQAQAALTAREAELAQTQATLTAREAELAQTQSALTAREAELAQTQTALTAREAELAQTQTALSAREAELAQTQTALSAREAELAQTQSALTARETELAQTQSALTAREAELARMQSALTAREAELAQTQAALTAREAELVTTRQSLAHRDGQLQQSRAAAFAHEQKLEQAQHVIQAHESELARAVVKGKTAARELGAFRERRIARIIERLRNRVNVWNAVGEPFQQLKDDTLLFGPDLTGYLLQPSENLQHVPFLYYPLELGRANLAGVLLAPILDFPSATGTLGVEIVSPENAIVAQAVIPLSQVNDVAPARVTFPAIRDSDRGRFWLRVFVREADVPVRVFEWRKYRLCGIKMRTQAFCGFVFLPS